MSALKSVFCPGNDITVFNFDRSAHLFQRGKVDVHRTGADGAAAGQGQFRIMFSGQKRPQHVVGSAHFAHVVVRCDQAFSLGCLVSVHFARIAVDYFVTTVNLCAELFQQQIHGANVGKGRHVGQGDAFPGEEGGAYQRQRRIFGAADVDLTGAGARR